MPPCRTVGTEDFLFQQVRKYWKLQKSHGKEDARMDTKTIIGIVLVAAVVGALAFLKIRARRK